MRNPKTCSGSPATSTWASDAGAPSSIRRPWRLTSIVAGSVAPAISVKLLEIYDSSLPIALYLAAASVVTLIAVYFTRETKGIDLADVDQADRDDLAKAGAA